MKKHLFAGHIFAALALFLIPALAAGAQTGGGRYALVIGEGGYETLKPALVNPLNDAADMKSALEGLGFTVELVQDGTLEKMRAGVDWLCERLSASPDTIGFFFYAGHGMQEASRNYLIPVEARLARVGDLQQNAFDVQFDLYDKLRVANNALNMVVLDACRDMPLARGVKLTEDLTPAPGLAAATFQPAGSIIVYATGPGQQASDGSGRNGLFTGKLLENLRNNTLAVDEVFRRTADAVHSANSRQYPAIYSQFHKQVYLGGGAAGTAEIAASPAAVAAAQIVYLEKRKPGRPDWLDFPLRYALANYEDKGSTLSSPQWYYAVGVSNLATTEQRARTRAQQNVQADVAATIASDFTARIDLTENSVFKDSDIEDVQRLIEVAVTNSIKTRVPRYEPLEWYIEKGTGSDGKEGIRAYVLVRLARQDMIDVVNKVDPEKFIDSLMAEAEKNSLIPRSSQMPPGDRRVMVRQVIEVRDYVIEGVRKGLTGN